MIEHWTSTQFHHWKRDCAGFILKGEVFEVQDIFTADQEQFYVNLCASHNYSFVRTKYNAICTPPGYVNGKPAAQKVLEKHD